MVLQAPLRLVVGLPLPTQEEAPTAVVAAAAAAAAARVGHASSAGRLATGAGERNLHAFISCSHWLAF
jgi:hypothetical protein